MGIANSTIEIKPNVKLQASVVAVCQVDAEYKREDSISTPRTCFG
jgi:hypothetical protein